MLESSKMFKNIKHYIQIGKKWDEVLESEDAKK